MSTLRRLSASSLLDEPTTTDVAMLTTCARRALFLTLAGPLLVTLERLREFLASRTAGPIVGGFIDLRVCLDVLDLIALGRCALANDTSHLSALACVGRMTGIVADGAA